MTSTFDLNVAVDALADRQSLDKHTVKRQNWTAVVMREKDILSTLSPHP